MKPLNGPEEESDVLALSPLETRLFSDWRIALLNVLCQGFSGTERVGELLTSLLLVLEGQA